MALIRQSCERLGLECYLDIKGRLDRTHLGICLDSLQRLTGPERLTTFKTIVIDESEQVLSHFLSDTMDRENRQAIYVIFKTLLRRAKRVVALDAHPFGRAPPGVAFETVANAYPAARKRPVCLNG